MVNAQGGTDLNGTAYISNSERVEYLGALLACSIAEMEQHVSQQIEKQNKKWGWQDHDPVVWLAIMAEEFGEVAKAVIEGNHEECWRELSQLLALGHRLAERTNRMLAQQ